MLDSQKGAPGKLVSVWWTHKMGSWKNGICSANRHTFLENSYLFGENIKPPEKNQKRVSLENRYLFGGHIKWVPGKWYLLGEQTNLPGKFISVW